jgi:prophage regulatory protein
MAEHEARRNRGEALSVKMEEGRALAEWLRVNHPDVRAPKPRTIAQWLKQEGNKSNL